MTDDFDADVVVIGAGFAGLGAARAAHALPQDQRAGRGREAVDGGDGARGGALPGRRRRVLKG